MRFWGWFMIGSRSIDVSIDYWHLLTRLRGHWQPAALCWQPLALSRSGLSLKSADVAIAGCGTVYWMDKYKTAKLGHILQGSSTILRSSKSIHINPQSAAARFLPDVLKSPRCFSPFVTWLCPCVKGFEQLPSPDFAPQACAWNLLAWRCRTAFEKKYAVPSGGFT